MATAHAELTKTNTPSPLAARIIRYLFAALFVAAAGAKFANVPAMQVIFGGIGVGIWLQYLTAAIEVAAAVLLLFSRTSLAGTLLVIGLMTGALLTHAFIIGGNAIPAVVIFALALVLLWLQRAKFGRVIKALL